ncbi:hypothetical protein EYF80_003183 [Liparis tanakae]|uniref:Uncharacterized protein n=1 Tax=Liparis tanakae TaxID=230148 RepID=A0A4Z2J9P5_9TELE|nr:hypothetical protein EYF80_003183 [Liparis tanakae]
MESKAVLQQSSVRLLDRQQCLAAGLETGPLASHSWDRSAPRRNEAPESRRDLRTQLKVEVSPSPAQWGFISMKRLRQQSQSGCSLLAN